MNIFSASLAAGAVALAAATVCLLAVRRRAPLPLGVAAAAVGFLGVRAAQMILWLNWGFPDMWYARQTGIPIDDVLQGTNAVRSVFGSACLAALIWAVTAGRRSGV